jgi:hypothetical protein
MKLPPFDAEFFSASCKTNKKASSTDSGANVSAKYSKIDNKKNIRVKITKDFAVI